MSTDTTDTTDTTDLQSNARLLRELHHNDMLVLPNVWDAASAAVVVEAGYGLEPRALVDGLLGIGAVGCNLEDTDHRNGALLEAGAHAEWLAAVRTAADRAGIPLVINARVDTFLPVGAVPEQDRVSETIRRGKLYRDAGADCVYPIGVRTATDIAEIVTALECPVNANVSPGLDLPQLRDLGVKRVSFGPRFYRAAMADLDVSVRGLLLQLSTTS